jgi:transcriptional regulator with XRE-family HTH domain
MFPIGIFRLAKASPPPNVPHRDPGKHFLNLRPDTNEIVPVAHRVTWKAMKHVEHTENSIDQRALCTASAFGSLIRGRRKALKLRQDQLALATGVGRRFLIELEAGKPSCQLGRSLLVAEALGLTFADILACRDQSAPEADLPELPDALPELPDELPEALADMEQPDGRPAGIF